MGAYAINLDEYKSNETHWVALYVNGDSAAYLDSFGVKHITYHNKYHNKYFLNTRVRFNNVQIFLYWIY